jgi:membrane-bound ClpP family serine protease
LDEIWKWVAGMALLRFLSGTAELTAAVLMLRYRSIETACRINGLLGLVGPLVLLLVSSLGIAGLSSRVVPGKLALIALGVLCILLGSRS